MLKQQAKDSIMPSISVLMPVYNGQEFLRDAIESILRQTFTDFEFIIVDDGSTDDSVNIIQEYAKKDERIRLVRHPENRGLIAAITTGNQHCIGEYIARMDADDVSLPDRFAKQYAWLQAHPQVDVLGCNSAWIDEKGNPLDSKVIEPSDPVQVWMQMFFRCAIHGATILARRKFYKRFNEQGLENDYVHAEDYAFWLRMGFEHQYANLDEILYATRRHGSRVSHLFTEVQRTNQVMAAKCAYQRMLDREIGIDVLRSFMFLRYYRFDNEELNREAIRTMFLFARTFTKKYSLTGRQKSTITKYLFDKIAWYTFEYHLNKSVLIEGLKFLFLLSPLNLFSWTVYLLEDKYLSRH